MGELERWSEEEMPGDGPRLLVVRRGLRRVEVAEGAGVSAGVQERPSASASSCRTDD